MDPIVLIVVALASQSNLFNGFSLLELAWQRIIYTFEQLFNPSQVSHTLRQVKTRQAIEGIKNNPFLGIGLGGTYFAPGNLLPWTEKHWVHNTFVQIPLRSGIFAFAIFLSIIIIFISSSRKKFNDSNEPISKAFIIGNWGALISMLILSISFATFFMHPIPAFIGICWGLIFSLERKY